MAERLSVLLELRPAFDGHSGIPQETRLLFSGLCGMPEVRAIGLLQSANLPAAPGLPRNAPAGRGAMSAGEQLSRLSKVVVSLQQGPSSTPGEHRRKQILARAGPVFAALAGAFGGKVQLTEFRPEPFKDYIWRALFAKTLMVEDFEKVTSSEFWIARWPWAACNAVGVASAALGHAMYPRLNTDGLDVFIAETPYPGRVSGTTQLVVRYHDAIPLLMPHTIQRRGYHLAMHYHALRRNAADGAWFACVSDAARADLLQVLPELESRAVTIPNMVSAHFHLEPDAPNRVSEIVESLRLRSGDDEKGFRPIKQKAERATPRYLLMVSTFEPRKNHIGLLEAWELLRARGHPDLQLICVGGSGWDSDATMARLLPWSKRGLVHLLQGVPARELRHLYRHAEATVCPSFGEGFDFSGVEAMRCGGCVAASDIPVHRGVYGDAAEYFNPYSAEALAHAVDQLMGPGAQARRDALLDAGKRVSGQYLSSEVLPQWQDFLTRVRHSK